MELLHRSDRLRELLTVTKFALMLLASCIVTGCFTHVEDPDPPTTECTAPEDCPDTQHLCKMCWTTEKYQCPETSCLEGRCVTKIPRCDTIR
jgi:hypothetical protein